MVLAVEILGIICMVTIMFISIWSFIILNKMYNQIKYHNYIMEKLSENLYMLPSKLSKENLLFVHGEDIKSKIKNYTNKKEDAI